MGNLKSGGRNVSDSTSNASLPLKHDTSSTLQQAKKFALESKSRMLKIKATDGNFVVTVKSATVPQGTTRILSTQEIADLRNSKHSVAERAMQTFRSEATKKMP